MLKRGLQSNSLILEITYTQGRPARNSTRNISGLQQR